MTAEERTYTSVPSATTLTFTKTKSPGRKADVISLVGESRSTAAGPRVIAAPPPSQTRGCLVSSFILSVSDGQRGGNLLNLDLLEVFGPFIGCPIPIMKTHLLSKGSRGCQLSTVNLLITTYL